MKTSIELTKPQLNPLADRNEHAALLLAPLLPDRLECNAMYLYSQDSGWDVEIHELVLVTDTSIEFLECRIEKPAWSDFNGQLIVRRAALTRTATCLPLRSVQAVMTTEDAGPRKEGEPQAVPERSYQFSLNQALGSLGEGFTLPRSGAGAYGGGALTTPEDDAARVADTFVAYLRGQSK